ncbi:MAG: phage integrase N-terminal SAM-like domain-containing protein, partial [Verrucomicrobiota bacterium]
EYANPVDYHHPYASMARFAQALALQYDANRTRHAYYRQLRLLHEHLRCDPASLTEDQLRDYFPFVKLKKQWRPKTLRQALAAARLFYIDLLQRPGWTIFSQIRTRDHDTLPAVLSRQQVHALLSHIRLRRRASAHDSAAAGAPTARAASHGNGRAVRGGTADRTGDGSALSALRGPGASAGRVSGRSPETRTAS